MMLLVEQGKPTPTCMFRGKREENNMGNNINA